MSQTRPTYAAAAPAGTTSATFLSRREIAERLHDMRINIEAELDRDSLSVVIPQAEAALLDDVCHALGLDDSQTAHVIGPAYFNLVRDRICAQMVEA